MASQFTVADLQATGLPVGEGIPTEEDLFAGLHCQKGETCTYILLLTCTHYVSYIHSCVAT